MIQFQIEKSDEKIRSWDKYFFTVCNAVASKSPCMSRKVGAILVRDHSIVSTGYNGPARGIPHCTGSQCPRRDMGFKSGEGLDHCPAQHGEENAVTNAARNGASTLGCTLYLNTQTPCKDCFSTLINAGIVEIVCTNLINYDKLIRFIIDNSNIKIREFEL